MSTNASTLEVKRTTRGHRSKFPTPPHEHGCLQGSIFSIVTVSSLSATGSPRTCSGVSTSRTISRVKIGRHLDSREIVARSVRGFGRRCLRGRRQLRQMPGNLKVSCTPLRGPGPTFCYAVDRVQWFRARADLTRVQEEINKLHAEFKRACLGFEALAAAWEGRTEGPGLSHGARAYAKKKADMYRRLGGQCAAAFAKVRKDPEEKWDYCSVSGDSLQRPALVTTCSP